MQAVQALQNPSALFAAFSVPGKFGVAVQTLNVTVPNVVVITATGIKIKYDPNATGPQELLRLQTASVTFPAVGLSANIGPSAQRQYGLIVRSDGFDLGHLDVTYRPGQTATGDGAGATPAPATIGFGDILRFNDIRLGLENFSFTSGARASFSGDIFIASGGVSFLPGRPVSATITDSASDSDTEAVRATLEFTDGHISAFKFRADTMVITLGSVLTLTAKNFTVDTGAGPNEPLVGFASIGAQVTVGGLVIGGEARNFQFNGDGSFHTRPGFGVFLSVGSASGDSFKWPSWLPIKVNQIGIQWADIEHRPADFVLTLSASVDNIKGIPGLTFSGSIDGVKIDVGKLLRGEFPIVDIAGFGVQVKGNLFGGQIDAELIGGILKLDALGNMIDVTDTTTPVADRIFYAGLEGGFEMPGVGGLTIRLGLSELGPLGVYLTAALPTGIMLVPQIGLVMNDFTAGVEFFKSLPSIDQPEELRGPAFQPPTAQTPDQWLASLKQQVVNQARAVKANPSMNGFTAAFTSPMIITGSAKIYSLFTSQAVFNGQVIVRLSTDGKFLIIGKLNFAADNISVSGRLYADLSRVTQGDVTVLFLADIPDQVRVLTIKGRLKMGFRDASGQEVEFAVSNLPPVTPTSSLAGPRDTDSVSAGDVNGRGFVDVRFDVPTGLRLDESSITDLGDDFTISSSTGTLALDSMQAPLLLDQDVLITDGPTMVAPGTVEAADMPQVTGFDLCLRGRVLGTLSMCPAPTAAFTSEGGFKAPNDYAWSAAAEDELNDRLAKLLENRGKAE